MAQNNTVERTLSHRYTRVDFIALRYKLSGIPLETIIDRVYTANTLQEREIHSPQGLGHWLTQLLNLQADLAQRNNPHLIPIISSAQKTGRWSNQLMSHLLTQGEKDYSRPKPEDVLAQWFKPRICQTLAEQDVYTLADFKALMALRGEGWWRPVLRLGHGKARAIVRWFEIHAESLGPIQWPQDRKVGAQLTLAGQTIVPLEQIGTIESSLNGTHGLNRNHQFCLISARDDLQALHAYLYKYRGQPLTFRAYQKELERFLLWCVCERRIAMSSVMQEECEKYKDFLAFIPSNWIGPPCPRTSGAWRPFRGQLSASSQKQAIQIIRSCFEWLVRVRYLGGNPWITVSDPAVAKRPTALHIERALPANIWKELAEPGGWLDMACDETVLDSRSVLALRGIKFDQYLQQNRLVRAMMLLLGTSGVRREESANATREHCTQARPEDDPKTGLWELAVLGKGNKWRHVLLTSRTVHAIAAHWQDRGEDFWNPSLASFSAPLLSPLIVPGTPAAQGKHFKQNSENITRKEFDAAGLYTMLKKGLSRIAQDPALDMPADLRRHLKALTPHDLRHTFATLAAAQDLPVDVLQSLLGHTSIQTTSIYIQSQRKRRIEEVEKMLSKN